MTEPTSEPREGEDRATEACSPRYARQIDRLVLDQRLTARQSSTLREHLKACGRCQQRYNRVVLAARLLDGGPGALTRPAPAELDRIREQVLQRVRLAPDPRPPRRWLRLAAGFATLSALLAISLVVIRRAEVPRARPQLQRRGSDTRGPLVGLRAFCLDEAKPPGIREVTGNTTTCRVEDRLTFAYTNRSDLGHLFVVGVDQKLALKWYRPAPPARTSVAAVGPLVDEPLGRTVRLAVNHDAGWLRIFAIFSAKPLTATAVSRAVARLQRQHKPIERIRRLPLQQTEQRTLLLRLAGPVAGKAKR